MKRIKLFLCLASLLSVIILSSQGILSQTANDTSIVEVNIIGFANFSGNISDVSIVVPDHIFLGNVTKDSPISDEVKIYINNTGRVPITVTPQLADSEETIFSYLYFRSLKTSNGTAVPFTRIGDYSIEIDKPLAGKSYSSKYCYISLDLTDFSGTIKEDINGYKNNIVFLAMSK